MQISIMLEIDTQKLYENQQVYTKLIQHQNQKKAEVIESIGGSSWGKSKMNIIPAMTNGENVIGDILDNAENFNEQFFDFANINTSDAHPPNIVLNNRAESVEITVSVTGYSNES